MAIFAALRRSCPIKLFIATTHADSGKLRIFRNPELSVDTLLVLLSPLRYDVTPDSAQDIKLRLRELAFNSTFLREMRMFAHVREQISATARPRWLPRWLQCRR